jgi:cyclopropane fatty-acyl-phospholipid synthase-like methyltransferase
MQDTTSSFRDGFTKIYESPTPWDIGRPKAPFIAVADRIAGPVLDAGCGTGDTTLYFAAQGLNVTGIDFVEEAIRRAKAKAKKRGVTAEFLVKDAMTLVEWNRRFASVIDSGLFHVYENPTDQKRYVSGLAHVLNPGGRLYLYGFSDEEPSAPGGGLSRQDLEKVFSDGWTIESVHIVPGEINPAFAAEHPDEYPSREPKMIFAIIRSTA